MESDEIQRLGNEHSPVQPLSVRQFSLKMQLGRPLQCFIAGRRLRLHPCSDGAIREREYRSQRNLATASRRSLTGRSESTREVARSWLPVFRSAGGDVVAVASLVGSPNADPLQCIGGNFAVC